MKQYIEKIDNTPRKYKELVARTCDICGSDGKTQDWGEFTCKYNETQISIKIRHMTGETYGNCGNEDRYEIDICPKCFQTKLIPWLESQGVNKEIVTIDW